ncbi:MAG: diaminopimelate epimerase [Propionicimonas sp.]|uniref:diaminopimelate epimerase n=1 Tax=Propionicimonas sp. TaxID=1955623 RepID=UPI002B1F5EB2|nr:diaminopimelate epimerase [Propionicimonas sp.]MEA4943696.1 diaminopimelate epimerase [Propionicimonas sp.]MEA5116449.1 diaminopimelate epimerase [Propionicimonas sp.]
MRELPFVKGHGARNDFVLFTDPENRVELSDAEVAAICDRRAGIGADGVLRAVRDADGQWFMDYRNADGSLAEMCGNGLRVFLRYLASEGLVHDERVTVGTRAGERTGTFLPDGRIAVTMGAVRIDPDRPEVTIGDRCWPGIPADVGNPHVVSVVADQAELDALDLCAAPGVPDGRFPHGVNVEFVALLEPGHVRMRVHERGSGETWACGTGVVAVAVSVGGAVPGGDPVRVTTPGGDLAVHVQPDGEAVLTGPAVLVARGVIDLEVIG